MKQFVCSKLGNIPDKIRAVFERTDLNSMIWSQLKFRDPWELLWGNISKDNICVLGDAFHPMTPDIGQGGCSALEDAVVLSRNLADALTGKSSTGMHESSEVLEHRMIEIGLKKFARERRWRSIKLVTAAYVVGFVQQSDGILLSFLREKVFAKFLGGILFKMSTFDCGKLVNS